VRWKKDEEKLATLLLGLYADDGRIDYVGSAAVGAKRNDEIAAKILPLRKDEPLGHRGAARGGGSAGARRRGSLRQGRAPSLPARDAADSLPTGQGSAAVHVARGAAGAERARPHRAEAPRRFYIPLTTAGVRERRNEQRVADRRSRRTEGHSER